MGVLAGIALIDPEIALKLTGPQLMLYCAGIKRWPLCPQNIACPADQCLHDCKPLEEWHGEMPAYLQYTGTLKPIEVKRSPEALLCELPTVNEINQVLATIPPPVVKWRVLYIEHVPHQIESTHDSKEKADARVRFLGDKYVAKETTSGSPQFPAVALLERVKKIVEEAGR